MIQLEATIREQGGASRLAELRKNGKVPAILYGAGLEPQSLVLNARAFRKIFEDAGESTLIDLKIEGQEEVKILIKDVQCNPVDDTIVHGDLLRVDMNKPLEAEVSLAFVGIAPAVKELGGILNTQIKEIKIRCLPKDLVHTIEIDISGFKNFGDIIHIKDCPIPNGIEVLANPDDVVIMVSEPISEEELAKLEEVPTESASEPVVVGKEEKKTEEDTNKKE